MFSVPTPPRPRTGLRSALILVPALAFLARGGAAQERFTIAGGKVAIYNLAGRTSVERGTGSAVVVEVTRGGRDGARLRVEQGPVGDHAALRVVYPGDRVAYPQATGSSELRVRDDGTFGGPTRGREGRRVRVDREGEEEAWADLRVLVPAGLDVELRVAVGEMSARGVSANLLLDTHSGGVTAEDLRGRIRIDTGSGTVLATGIEGELEVDTGSGDVVVRNARVGTLGVDTGSGAVTIEGFRADALHVDTGSGGVRGEGDAEEVEVDTGSGDVSLDLGALLRNVMVDSGSGDVTLTVPANYGARVSLETSSGDLEVNVPLQVVRRGQDALEGTIGDGRGQLTVDTGSGNITVRRK
jgi:hypothetical protein